MLGDFLGHVTGSLTWWLVTVSHSKNSLRRTHPVPDKRDRPFRFSVGWESSEQELCSFAQECDRYMTQRLQKNEERLPTQRCYRVTKLLSTCHTIVEHRAYLFSAYLNT